MERQIANADVSLHPQYEVGSYASREEASAWSGDPYSGREEAPQRGGGDSYGGVVLKKLLPEASFIASIITSFITSFIT